MESVPNVFSCNGNATLIVFLFLTKCLFPILRQVQQPPSLDDAPPTSTFLFGSVPHYFKECGWRDVCRRKPKVLYRMFTKHFGLKSQSQPFIMVWALTSQPCVHFQEYDSCSSKFIHKDEEIKFHIVKLLLR